MKFEVIRVNILIVEDEYSLADAIAETLKKKNLILIFKQMVKMEKMKH